MRYSFRAYIKALLLIIWLVVFSIVLFISLIFKNKNHMSLVAFVYKLSLLIINIKVRIKGEITEASPVFFISNHVSYIDIPVLGAILKTTFIAKDDIRNWPVLGQISSLVKPLFIVRKVSKSKENADIIENHINKHHSVIMFPEGSTSEGRTLIPFNSSFFGITYKVEDLTIQPVLLKYTRINGLPISTSERHYIYWIGDMELMPHLWELLKLYSIDVEVELLDPIKPRDYSNRKKLALACYSKMKEKLCR